MTGSYFFVKQLPLLKTKLKLLMSYFTEADFVLFSDSRQIRSLEAQLSSPSHFSEVSTHVYFFNSLLQCSYLAFSAMFAHF